jgi:hypothetical protein
MGVVDVSRNFLFFARNLNSEEDDGEPPSIEHFFFSFGKQIEEGVAFSVRYGGC